jgi:acetyl-CoA carboxylase biotin carboxyl carrier protein
VDLRKVKKLIELVEESGISELEVKSGDESIRIAMGNRIAGAWAQPVAPAATLRPGPASHSTPGQALPEAVIEAPMAGTFYCAPHPDADPYVNVGDEIAAGEVVCIIESMKMMHEIKAATGGRITAVCVANATPIGTGDALFTLS